MDELEPPMRRKRGRPKTGKQKEKRIQQQHQKDRPLNCECGKDCIEAFDGNLRTKINCEFDELPNLPIKSTWLTTHVELAVCKLKGTALQVRRRSRKKYTTHYYFFKRGEKIRVCKYFFQTLLGIGNTATKNLLDHNFKHINNQMVQRVDLRGKHKPKHAVTQEEIEIIKNHILKFPREKSHYTLGRVETLSPELDIKQMWQLYFEQEESAERTPLGYNTYRKEFNTYNFKFGKIRADTCQTCDELKLQMNANPDDEDLKTQKAEHLRLADMAYTMQMEDNQLAQKDHRVKVLHLDMMSVQQVPKISTSASFYLRKYKVYCEDIFDSSKNMHNMYLWGQLDGKKGSIDVISCLHQSLEQIPDSVKHLILWFDNTSSQLKNTNLLLYLLDRTDSTSLLFKFEQISVKCAPVGHTYSGCDRHFATVTKRIRKTNIICNPRELLQIANACKNTKGMWLERDKHYDWGKYLKCSVSVV